MRWHVVEGIEGCCFARETKASVVIVDALRASATSAALLEAGATHLLVVQEVDSAFSARDTLGQGLLYGERDGLPPQGFDGGNSPRIQQGVQGKPVIFTTTNGARLLVEAWGSRNIYMGSTVNASAVVDIVSADEEVVLVPAGLWGHPEYNAQEDWVAAAVLIDCARSHMHDFQIGEGKSQIDSWHKRISEYGVDELFATAPHAKNLRSAGLEADIRWCAQVDVLHTVPRGIERNGFGVVCQASRSV